MLKRQYRPVWAKANQLHPDKIVILKRRSGYVTYDADARQVLKVCAQVLGLQVKPDADLLNEKIFVFYELEKVCKALLDGGYKVAIADEAPAT